MALVAWPNDTPGARLNDTVSATNRPWCCTLSGAFAFSRRVNADSGTRAPAAVITSTWRSDSMSCANFGSTPSTT
ncbi:hypothetical protein D9M68_639840 [compost metagenome]